MFQAPPCTSQSHCFLRMFSLSQLPTFTFFTTILLGITFSPITLLLSWRHPFIQSILPSAKFHLFFFMSHSPFYFLGNCFYLPLRKGKYVLHLFCCFAVLRIEIFDGLLSWVVICILEIFCQTLLGLWEKKVLGCVNFHGWQKINNKSARILKVIYFKCLFQY